LKKTAKILLILLFCVNSLFAQENTLTVNSFEIKDGLSQNYMSCVMQDHSGIIWIGTQDGLNKFNGYEFEKYRYNSNNINSLSGNYINDTKEDQFGNIWIATQGGLNKYNPQKNKFTVFLNNPEDENSISKNFIFYVFIDKNNDVWALTDATLEYYDSDKNIFEHYPLENNPNTTYLSYNNLEIVDYKEGFLIATKDALIYFNTKERKIEQKYVNNPTDNTTISHNQVTTIYKDRSGKIWIGTENGLNIFNNGKFKQIYYNGNKNEEQNIVYSVFQDNTGFIWVGTNEGLRKLRLCKDY